MNIDEMPAGRCLDALVAEKVMGWTDTGSAHGKTFGRPPKGNALYETVGSIVRQVRMPRYSTDIAAAWQVVERVITGTVWECYLAHQFDGWGCLFSAPDKLDAHGAGESAPLAICRAALELEGK